MTKYEMMFLNLIWSCIMTMIMFIFTASLLHILDGTDLSTTDADAGVIALILFFLTTFITTHYVVIEHK